MTREILNNGIVFVKSERKLFAGESLEDVMYDVVKESMLTGVPMFFVFNGIPVFFNPGDIIDQYQSRMNYFSAEYRFSNQQS